MRWVGFVGEDAEGGKRLGPVSSQDWRLGGMGVCGTEGGPSQQMFPKTSQTPGRGGLCVLLRSQDAGDDTSMVPKHVWV